MSLDISALQILIDNKLKSIGMKASFSRLGSKIGSGYIVVTTSENKAENTLNDNVSKICYLANKVKFIPLPGDVIAFNKEEWIIKEVAKYEPSGVAIAYKITME